MASVILVDDSKVSRVTIRGYLEQLGHDIVGEGSDGVEGVKLFKELKPDMVFMDIEMPNLDGIAALEQIIRAEASAKVVMVTSIRDKKEILVAQKKGAMGVINKPVVLEELKTLLQNILKG